MRTTGTVIGLTAVLFSFGCIQRDAIVKDTFLLNAQRPGSAAQESSGPVLAVKLFSIAPAYADKDLVRQVGDFQYESSYYNEYFVSPATMITDQARNWLTESGLFAAVLPPASTVSPKMILEGHIRELKVDLQDEPNPKAVLEIMFILLEYDKRQGHIRFQKAYMVSEPMEDRSSRTYIAAQNAALVQILASLEKDLAANL